MIKISTTLEALWNDVDALHQSHFPNHQLQPIHGNGKTTKPRFMFVFINPTIKNISSNKEWGGPRFPFIGTKQIWRIFHRAGFFDEQLLETINANTNWTLAFTNDVLDSLKKQSFYFTNLVKWTGTDAALPKAAMINLFLPLLEREIAIVQPQHIVTFGLLPFHALTKQPITLQDYYDQSIRTKRLQPYPLTIGTHTTTILPCYFPIGRGNPKRAVELLKLLPD